ncbi:MAG: hypothetical protein US25_C0078G0003 [Candidatus Moranbacteria bacterium GW2011_GWE1_36_7]|nr:MAG: hypothetical protein UR99_C0068G0003 [Candidatus Moranbacteria bacterium GW2011_GWD2_36_12]KKQ04471.1 MAG: hypothetical protein US16_C0058G0003 [Candidatus Moranbacteria bacterium GW2011_GWE2_36_40]KKQ11632.1 MAG: hypothetical protein US25_C0078G0003 [Candidatus Moranbacteria bacterium GW2011_GWE1_36_7]
MAFDVDFSGLKVAMRQKVFELESGIFENENSNKLSEFKYDFSSFPVRIIFLQFSSAISILTRSFGFGPGARRRISTFIKLSRFAMNFCEKDSLGLSFKIGSLFSKMMEESGKSSKVKNFANIIIVKIAKKVRRILLEVRCFFMLTIFKLCLEIESINDNIKHQITAEKKH